MKLSIKQAVARLNISENYLRKSIARGEIAVTKEYIGDSRIPKNWIEDSELERWQASKTHSKREDGRNKFVLYANADELEQIEKILREAGLNTPIQRANLKKEEAIAE